MFPKDKIAQALKLYAVTDYSWLCGRTLEDCVSQALRGGVTFVQLRQKGATTNQLVEQAEKLIPLCRRAGVPFVIDDDAYAAKLCGADGVHVGQSDATCADARRILGEDAIIGVSAQTVEQAIAAERAGADYLGVGAMFVTSTKPDADKVSLEDLRAICAAVKIPVVAIGGISGKNIVDLQHTGIAGVAVVSAIFAASDITDATAQLLRKVDRIIV